MKTLTTALTATFVLAAVPTLAGTQPYAGQDTREIASLSQADIDALLAGQGWGLAKPAELNGYPGPAHVLELATELDLSAAQRAEIQAIFDRMQAQARALGESYVEAEDHLSRMFRSGHADAAMLENQLARSSGILAQLRAVHLTAHLETTPLLNETQRAKYAELRGYGTATAGSGDHGGHGGHAHD
ncbi:Spy/CpxP family protein refolding chaperone [Seohaeicola saemankumensis]|nr:Spy/CpxP family protein refolding chaperone [Seohaeicola saemankumensis]MCA0870544.1 Spy/CpxP family protein refolding chaperone [Seohaeicola saemankumensis]